MTPQEAISMVSVTGAFTILLITVLLHFVLGNAVDDMFSLYLHLVSMVLSAIYVLFISIIAFGTDPSHNLVWGILVVIFWLGYTGTYYWMLSRQIKMIVPFNLKNMNIGMYSLTGIFALLGLIFYPLASINDTSSAMALGFKIVEILTLVVVNGLIITIKFYVCYQIFKTVMSISVKSYNEILIRMNMIILVIAIIDLGLVFVDLFETNYHYTAVRGCYYAFRTQIEYLCLGKVRQVYVLIRENQAEEEAEAEAAKAAQNGDESNEKAGAEIEKVGTNVSAANTMVDPNADAVAGDPDKPAAEVSL
ncbi:hypothetical protein CONCODRAFT_68070 [Conidiobolus coronatus NRRL 28638]|uniref:Uncharacterized protein n=1 Tax=Conidiobolus coronatus (strain ATCC 28846 / CBS 209.66 / NRRL 28638) TaxID=796925 RepID=A0A137PFH5_CONC2|nr:hypothetical protein CONCODRAFT_68070 [Conidiobolus coronatus NRRL 28638]|eukprot:KXN73754.1 hypothetical protein CONCODRAFT_68070 [Conidiobolus coronatus NRRL 28638]